MEQKQAIADRLKQSNNILVTVSNNPSVDQLASCIGLTLALNKMGKHATAVFSGNIPSTIEFLQPEKTIEKNTDSLRDFIIALDKAKADKLRYKVEDTVVKIFITPYRTSITDKDLEFSQGDFNVDLVLAIGVHQQTELDQAIIAHGRILHDAVVATVNTKPGGELGTVNWVEPNASSLSELVVELLDAVDNTVMDGQMATAFLTGIVAETHRFSNEKTTPTTMSISAELMAAGANQQLVATKLEEPAPSPKAAAPLHIEKEEKHAEEPDDSHTTEDGTLEINHPAGEEPAPTKPEPSNEPLPRPAEEEKSAEPPTPQIHIDDQGSLRNMENEHVDNHRNEPLLGSPSIDPTQHMASSHMILEPPSMGGQLTANAVPEDLNVTDPLSLPQPSDQEFNDSFGPSPASATITAPTMPYLPPSMTPGGATPPSPEPPMTPAPAVNSATPTNAQDTIQAAPPTILAPQPQPSAPAPFVMPEPIVQPSPGELAAPPPVPSAAPAGETLTQLEADVNSPHLQPEVPPSVAAPSPIMPSPLTPEPPVQPTSLPTPEPTPSPEPPSAAEPTPPSADLDSARNAVMQAIAAQSQPSVGSEPIQALNAQPLGAPLHGDTPSELEPRTPVNFDAAANPTFTLPDTNPPNQNIAPPATPPPIMPPQGNFGQ